MHPTNATVAIELVPRRATDRLLSAGIFVLAGVLLGAGWVGIAVVCELEGAIAILGATALLFASLALAVPFEPRLARAIARRHPRYRVEDGHLERPGGHPPERIEARGACEYRIRPGGPAHVCLVVRTRSGALRSEPLPWRHPLRGIARVAPPGSEAWDVYAEELARVIETSESPVVDGSWESLVCRYDVASDAVALERYDLGAVVACALFAEHEIDGRAAFGEVVAHLERVAPEGNDVRFEARSGLDLATLVAIGADPACARAFLGRHAHERAVILESPRARLVVASEGRGHTRTLVVAPAPMLVSGEPPCAAWRRDVAVVRVAPVRRDPRAP